MRRINEILETANDSVSSMSVAIDANQLISASFQAYFGDSSAAGTFKIQASNDPFNASYNYPEGQFVPTNWVDVPQATTAIASGAPAIIILSTSCFRWLRAVYTPSGGGTTTITIELFALSY